MPTSMGTPANAAAATHRYARPETKMIAKPAASSTIPPPMSFSRKINTANITRTTPAWNHPGSSGSRSSNRRPSTVAANATATNFANSDGWNRRSSTVIQRRAPFTS